MADAHKNFAVSTVATAPSPATSGTSLVVASGHGTRFPTPPFNATIWPSTGTADPSNAEIVRVTNISTDTLTITRAQEGSTARTVVVGDRIAATITAKTLTDVETSAGGVSQTYYGYNVAGGSFESMTSSRMYAKQITLATDGLITNVQAYMKGNGSNVGSLATFLLEDASGAPGKLLGYEITFQDSVSFTTTAGWVGRSIGVWCPAGTYWIGAISLDDTAAANQIGYDGSGSDQIATTGGGWVSDGPFVSWSNSSNRYSIRANVVATSLSGTQKSITQSSHGFAVGDVLYLNGSMYAKAKADAASTAEVVGITQTVIDANTFVLQTNGYLAGLSGLTAGSTYFLSPSTAGALTATEPTTTGHVSKPLLVATGTTAGYFVNWRGVVIASASDWTEVVKASDESVSSSTALQDDNDLFFATTNGAIYEFEMLLIYGSPVGLGTPDMKYVIGEDTTFRGMGVSIGQDASGGSNVASIRSELDATALVAGTDALDRAVKIIGHHWGAGGTFKLQWAQNTSSGNATIMRARSVLRYRRVN